MAPTGSAARRSSRFENSTTSERTVTVIAIWRLRWSGPRQQIDLAAITGPREKPLEISRWIATCTAVSRPLHEPVGAVDWPSVMIRGGRPSPCQSRGRCAARRGEEVGFLPVGGLLAYRYAHLPMSAVTLLRRCLITNDDYFDSGRRLCDVVMRLAAPRDFGVVAKSAGHEREMSRIPRDMRQQDDVLELVRMPPRYRAPCSDS